MSDYFQEKRFRPRFCCGNETVFKILFDSDAGRAMVKIWHFLLKGNVLDYFLITTHQIFFVR